MAKKGHVGKGAKQDSVNAELVALLTASAPAFPIAKQKPFMPMTSAVEGAVTEKTSSIVGIAESLKATTSFTDFVCAGHGSTMLFDGVIFGYTIEERNGCELRSFSVLHSEKLSLKMGFTVTSAEVAQYAQEGSRYYPSMKAANVAFENMRSVMINTLLSAIDQTGGHHAVVRTIVAKRRHERERVENEACAKKIIADIRSGELSGDLMRIFDSTLVNTVGVIFEGKPLVLCSGRMQIGMNPRSQHHAVAVVSDPMHFCRSDAVVVVQDLFQGQRFKPSEVLAAAIRSVLIGSYLVEAKAAVVALGGVVPDDVVVGEVAPQPTSTTVSATDTLQ